jgi:hypothetical protein
MGMNRYCGIALSLACFLTACASGPQKMHVFDGLTSEQAYWVKSLEVATEGNRRNAKGFPAAFKSCFAEKIVENSSPALHLAVNKFMKDTSTANYAAISQALGTPRTSFMEAVVVKNAVGQCETVYHEAVYENFRNVRTYRDYSMALLKVASERDGIALKDLPQDVIDCFIDEYWRGLPEALRKPVDIFLKDRSMENWLALNQSISEYGDKDKARSTRIKGACKAKFP